MNEQTPAYIDAIEQRTSMLRALARELVECRKDFVALDTDAMFGRISTQEELCREIRAIDLALATRLACAAKAGTPATDSASTERLRAAVAEMQRAQAELAQFNRIHAAYLRRCGRTARLSSNFFRSLALTYTPERAEFAAPAGGR